MYVSTVKYDTSHERKSTCVLGYWELPNHRVLSNSVTDAVPYVGRDTAAVSLPPSLDGTELKKGRKKKPPLLADRGCTHSRPNGTNQHRVEEKKTLIRHICLCSRQANEKLFPEVTCIRTKRLGVILVSLTLFHCCSVTASDGEPYGNPPQFILSHGQQVWKDRVGWRALCCACCPAARPLALAFVL